MFSIPTGKFGKAEEASEPVDGGQPANPASDNPDKGPAQEGLDKNTPDPKPNDTDGGDPTNKGQQPEPSKPSEDYNEDKIKSFFKEKYGKEIDSFDEFLKPKEETKQDPTPSPEKKEKDEEVSLFERFKEKTGGSFKEFSDLHKDWKEVSDVDIIREQVKEESGITDTKKVDSLIKRKYGLGAEENLSSLEDDDKILLEADANKYRKEKSKYQQETLESLKQEQPESQDSQRSDREMVTLNNGVKIPKADYDKKRAEYLEGNQKAIESLSEAKFSTKLKTGDGEKDFDFSYKYTDADKQGMLSGSEDLSKVFDRFKSEDDKLNQAELNEGLLWADKKWREKTLATMFQQVLSEGINEQLKEEKNITSGERGRSRNTSQPSKTSKIDLSKLPGGQTFGPKYSRNK